MTLEVNVFNVAKQPPDKDECYHVDMIDTLLMKQFYKSHKFDPLNLFLHVVDNERSFYPDNVANISIDFKT